MRNKDYVVHVQFPKYIFSKLVKTFKNAKFSVVYSNENRQGSSNRHSFNLKDEGIGIDNIYVNDGFAEYQHDIGKSQI